MVSFRLKKGLGRGLSSLIGEASTNTNISKISITDISRNKYQPRKNFNKEDLNDLTNSIKERGLIQPIVVRPNKNLEGKYEIIAGERRWLASQNAGLHMIPVVILDINDEKSLEFAIVENVQRKDLNSIEEAQGYKKLVDEFNYNQDKLSKFIGKSRSYIANSLRLLSLPTKVMELVEKNILTTGHVRALIGFNNAEELAKIIIQKKYSVRQTENFVKHLKTSRKIKIVSNRDTNIIELEKLIEEKIGLKTQIKNKRNNSGKISFEYSDLDQLTKLTSIIKNNF